MEQLKNCKEKFIYVDGYRFTRDERTGYHRCNALRKRLHQYVWEKHKGKVKEGCHIHHKDGNKANNHISNLQEMVGIEHIKHHMNNLSESTIEAMRKNMDNKARPEANKWHRSEEGREWHKEHYESMKDKLHQKKSFKCKQCGNVFGKVDTGANKFCSNNCKSKWRRSQGLDEESRVCVICSVDFTTNKYSKAKTCSRSCRNKIRKLNKSASS